MGYRKEEEKVEAIGAGPSTLDRVQQIQALIDHRDALEKVVPLPKVASVQNVYQDVKPLIEQDVTISLIDKAIAVEKRSLDIADGYLKEAEKEREKLTKYSQLQHLLEAEQEKFGKKKEIILSPEVYKAWKELHQTDSEIPEIQDKKAISRDTFLSVLSHVSTTCDIVPSKVQSLMARVHHTWNKSLTIMECARRGMHHIMDTLRHITRQSSPK